MKRNLTASLLLFSIALLPACSEGTHSDDHGHSHDAAPSPFDAVSKAVCVLSPTNNQDLPGVTGTITFTQTKQGLLVEAEVTGLKPDAKHGFHVHQWGDLSKPDGTATGGHYNPTGAELHSLPEEHAHGDHTHSHTGGHAGDMGNLESDADGNASYSKTFENITLIGKNAVLGRGIIVHLDEDKGIDAQPTGGAGPRVAQGVIGIADPE